MKLPFEINLNGKVAVVTGAGGVLMSEFAKALAACGARVALLDINAEAAEAVASAIGENALAIPTNCLDKAEIQKAAEIIHAKWGKVNFLINGVLVDPSEWDSVCGRKWVGSGVDEVNGSVSSRNLYLLGEGYDIVFDPRGGTSTSELMTSVDGRLLSLPLAAMDGSEFLGWWTDPSGGVLVDADTEFDDSEKAVLDEVSSGLGITGDDREVLEQSVRTIYDTYRKIGEVLEG